MNVNTVLNRKQKYNTTLWLSSKELVEKKVSGYPHISCLWFRPVASSATSELNGSASRFEVDLRKSSVVPRDFSEFCAAAHTEKLLVPPTVE